MKERLTVRQAAERLGVAYSTLKRWIATGVVRTTLTEGGHHRIARVRSIGSSPVVNPQTDAPHPRWVRMAWAN